MVNFWQYFGRWSWELITGIEPLINWIITPIEIAGYTVAPIYLIGGGAGAVILIAGIVRAIL